MVVTIVVLLILAGITLVYVFGDNGIIKLAQKAKDETENAIKNEQEDFGEMVNLLRNEYNGGSGNGNNEGGGGNTTDPINPPTPEEVPVENIKSDWVTLSKIAEAISNDSSVTKDSEEATVIVEGKSYTIKVGDIFEVTYDPEGENVVKEVRVLGFKHDTLVKNYDGTANTVADTAPNSPKAGITFDFVDFMTGITYLEMNSTNTITDGWGATKMREYLNVKTKTGTHTAVDGAIGGEGAKLSNKDQIKQVKKDYITTWNTGVQSKSNDYLWLLSYAEIVNTGYEEGTSGQAKTREGSQYPYYKEVTTDENGEEIPWNVNNPALVKKGNDSITDGDFWWLRSPMDSVTASGARAVYFGSINKLGSVAYHTTASYPAGVAPGFCL